MTTRDPRSVFLRAVLWIGLVLCVVAVWKGSRALEVDLASVGWRRWLVFAGGLALGWGLAVAAWRETSRAFTGVPLPWRRSMRQTGLLLIGKYLPGGVFGFLARMMDDAALPRAPRLGAGMVEQGMSLAAVVLTGLLLYVPARSLMAAWAPWPFLLVVPVALFVTARMAVASWNWLASRGRLSARAPEVRVGSALATCAVLIAGQAALWALLVVLLASWLFDLDSRQATAVAGAFGLAVGAGMLAVFAPGGIGVREGALVALVSPFMPVGHALVLAAALRLASASVDVVAGFIAALLGRLPQQVDQEMRRPNGEQE